MKAVTLHMQTKAFEVEICVCLREGYTFCIFKATFAEESWELNFLLVGLQFAC
jgi:hypothetical protein